MNETLVTLVRRFTDQNPSGSPYVTAIPGLAVVRANDQNHTSHLFFHPTLCLTLQGTKSSLFGGRTLVYGPGETLVVNVGAPGFSRILAGSPTEPYLGLILELDPAVLRSVWEDLDPAPTPGLERSTGMFVTSVDDRLADCALRLFQLLDNPSAIPVLAPMVHREIAYWLLTGAHGGEVARIAFGQGPSRQVVEALQSLRHRFTQSIAVDELAALARMSPSAFHRHFKTLTSMTPLQYQKQLRLLEARRLLLDGANAETAAFAVGYESASQFSREYSRHFGAPPRRDVGDMRGVAV